VAVLEPEGAFAGCECACCGALSGDVGEDFCRFRFRLSLFFFGVEVGRGS
jgi:hypothetical protein